jgi:hypothetical protein
MAMQMVDVVAADDDDVVVAALNHPLLPFLCSSFLIIFVSFLLFLIMFFHAGVTNIGEDKAHANTASLLQRVRELALQRSRTCIAACQVRDDSGRPTYREGPPSWW